MLLLKQIVILYIGMHSRSTYPILRTTYPNNSLFSRVNSFEDVRDKWNFRGIEQVHCGYICMRVRLPSKKKT